MFLPTRGAVRPAPTVLFVLLVLAACTDDMDRRELLAPDQPRFSTVYVNCSSLDADHRPCIQDAINAAGANGTVYLYRDSVYTFPGTIRLLLEARRGPSINVSVHPGNPPC